VTPHKFRDLVNKAGVIRRLVEERRWCCRAPLKRFRTVMRSSGDVKGFPGAKRAGFLGDKGKGMGKEWGKGRGPLRVKYGCYTKHPSKI